VRVDAILTSEHVRPAPSAPPAAVGDRDLCTVELNHAGRNILRRLLKRAAVKP
jgi:hypothetical protein